MPKADMGPVMRNPIYKTRPVEPNPARYPGERINDFIVLSEAYSNCYLLQTAEGNIQVNSGMGMEAPVIKKNFDDFSDIVRNPKFVCIKCGRVAGKKKWLHKAVELK